MTIGSVAKLYTSEVLGLAVQLARYPLSDDFASRGEARSRTCGSSLTMGLSQGDDGEITQIGMQVSACAIGQAAAAIFAADAKGRTLADIERAKASLEGWLHGAEEMPAWSGISTLEEARSYSSRHGAILLPWSAAIEALSKAQDSR
ncbi:iron-sulfur cluster assembly scaffold protein [Altererythrobacter lutimaris]|uniref:Iron-sulfur cluster assembly scaffold protein n=1 Tax=Altererythrobacter lutimaris TaxID=2743979 RepID=A0A850HAV9_9SPHN|nr:iron-sulfur cluster assembly scaffold protein [Altererythrobacter lutimaris]NVE94036.1 iron-sulfur cluster assembly scaffold protein [Altererythrobacter lutimaris]